MLGKGALDNTPLVIKEAGLELGMKFLTYYRYWYKLDFTYIFKTFKIIMNFPDIAESKHYINSLIEPLYI